MHQENLEQYLETYRKDPFAFENKIMLHTFSSRCIQYSVSKKNYLELGIGHGITIENLSGYFEKVIVLEASPTLVNQYKNKYDNVELHETYFENFESTQRFDNIGMGFVLEHVDDPAFLLNKYRKFLTKNGSIFIGVPSASSLHRILAFKAGMLKDICQLSDTDINFGHKRYLTYHHWITLLKNEGLRIERVEGLYLKPFSTQQIQGLNLDSRIVDALVDVSKDYPEISNSLFIEVKNG